MVIRGTQIMWRQFILNSGRNSEWANPIVKSIILLVVFNQIRITIFRSGRYIFHLFMKCLILILMMSLLLLLLLKFFPVSSVLHQVLMMFVRFLAINIKRNTVSFFIFVKFWNFMWLYTKITLTFTCVWRSFFFNCWRLVFRA